MARFDFDTPVSRRGSGSFKWDANERLFGARELLPFWVADMDFATPSPVRAAVAARLQHPVLGYEERQADYVQAVTGWLARRHDWRVPEDWLVFCPPSAIVGIYGALVSLTDPGDGVVVQTPTYGPLPALVTDSGRRLQQAPLGDDGERFTLDAMALGAAVDEGSRALILCNPHNPTGRVFSKQELAAVVELARANELLVISDEVHADLLRPGYRHIPFGAMGYERSITVISPNKSFNTAGLPQATLVVPDAALRKALHGFLDTVQLNHDSSFGGPAMIAGYTECEDWLDAVNAYIDANHRHLAERLSQLPGMRVRPAEATYLVWLDYRELSTSEARMQEALTKAGVALYAGSLFGEAGRGFLRMNIACPRSTLDEGLDRITIAVNALTAG